MKGHTKTATRLSPVTLMFLGLLLISAAATAQVPVDESGKPLAAYPQEPFDDSAFDDDDSVLLDAVELEELVGPIALYPDDLLAIILPASTYPLEIVQAARFLDEFEDDNSLEPNEDWDDSVVALLNYPEVMRMLDENIDWTWKLGEAVLAQQAELIAAVESFRDRAYAAGNLKTDQHQEVTYENGSIEIVPVDDEIIYVPYYEPAEVVVAQPRRVYYYYPDPYPVYYYPYPSSYRFRTGFFWGVTTAYTIGWRNHYLNVYHPSYWGHPYYGRYYYGHYYRRPSITVYNTWYVDNYRTTNRYRYRDGDRWRHRRRAGTTVVNNYHYSSNGSRNSRDYTVTRRNQFRVEDRSGNHRRGTAQSSISNSRNSAADRTRTSANRSRNTIEFRDRRQTPAAVNTGRRTAADDASRSRQQDTRGNNRVREHTPGTTRQTGSRRSTTVTPTRTRPQETRATIQFRDRSNESSRRATDARRQPASVRTNSGNNQRRTAPSTSYRPPAAIPNRAASSSNRQRSSAGSSRPSMQNNRTTRPSAEPGRTPRASAPSRPRAEAPAVRRPQTAPRNNTRSSGRSESRAAPERRSSNRRVRPNND